MLPFDEPAAVEHARLRLTLRQTPIGERDLMIAAIALAHRLDVATINTTEFKRVPKLKVVDWTR